MNKLKILTMSLCLACFCGFMLSQEISKNYLIGRYLWFGDVFYSNVTNVSICILAIISTISQYYLSKVFSRRLIGFLLRSINWIYGLALFLLGFMFLETSFFSLINGENANSNAGRIYIIVTILINYFLLYLGILVILQLIRKEKATQKINDENVLDDIG